MPNPNLKHNPAKHNPASPRYERSIYSIFRQYVLLSPKYRETLGLPDLRSELHKVPLDHRKDELTTYFATSNPKELSRVVHIILDKYVKKRQSLLYRFYTDVLGL